MSKLPNVIIQSVLSVLVLFAITACRTIPLPNRTMEFEPGINALASNIADQLERSSISNMLNKVVINPLTKQKQLTKIAIDPFIDVESGYPVKANVVIANLISKEIGKRFAITGEMDPENLEMSEYVLNGMVTLQDKLGKQEKAYKVSAAVFQKTSGKVLASASVYINSFDTTPMDIYKDSPVFLKGKNYKDHVASVSKTPDATITKGYNDRLTSKAMLVKGDTLYEKQEFNKSLAYYNQVAGGQNKPELEVLNGQFTNLVKQGQMENAEHVYIKLLKTSMSETNEVANKIIFAPNATVPLESYANLYKIYLRQIANLVAASPGCRVQIIGHSSRSGSASYNDKLSMQRAEWIKHQMVGYSPKSSARSQTIGRGFNENIVGSGKDDITDAIDRRVEFKFNNCEVGEGVADVKNELPVVAPPAEAAVPTPLKIDDIEFLLKNKVSSKLIAPRIAERGVNFVLDDNIRKRLKKLKAGEQMFKAIDEANAGKKRNE